MSKQSITVTQTKHRDRNELFVDWPMKASTCRILATARLIPEKPVPHRPAADSHNATPENAVHLYAGSSP
jgi:hypothetical protein